MKVITCVLYDHISTSSFLSRQLKIDSLSDLFLSDHYYFEEPENWLPFKKNDKRVKFERLKKKLNIAEIKNYKPSPNEVVILWPMNRWPEKSESSISIFNNLIDKGSGIILLEEDQAFIFSQDKPALEENSFAIESFDVSADVRDIDIAFLASPCRSFNHLQIDGDVVLKSSENIEKGRSEAMFYSMIPSTLSEYYPEFLGFFETAKEFSYRIPRYNMLDFSRILLHRNVSKKECEDFFAGLTKYFSAIPRKTVPISNKKNILRNLFVDKMNLRLCSYKNARFYDRAKEISNKLVNFFEDEMESVSDGDIYFSHGDLCFSNILIDRSSMSLLKLVDPRGAKCVEDAFLPLEYDLSKISQCVYGKYDLILARKTDEAFASIYKNLQIEFENLLTGLNVDKKKIYLGEASLYLSMLPLHMDHVDLHGFMIDAAEIAIDRYKEMCRAS